MSMLNRTGPRTSPLGTLLVTGLQLDFVPLITTLWVQSFSKFSVQPKLSDLTLFYLGYIFLAPAFPPGPWGLRFEKINLANKVCDKDDMQYISLFYVLCNLVPCFIQQWAHVFSSLFFLFFFFGHICTYRSPWCLWHFDIPDQIQFCLGFSFRNFMPDTGTTSLYSSQITHPCLQPLYTFFLWGWPGALCPSTQASWHFCLTHCLLKLIILDIREVVPWVSISFLRLLLPFRALSHRILIGLFQADPWRCWSLLSLSPGLWACFSPSSIPSGSWTPLFQDHCSQGCLWPPHSLQVPICWCEWGLLEHLPSLTSPPLGEVMINIFQDWSETSWWERLLLYCTSSRHQGSGILQEDKGLQARSCYYMYTKGSSACSS